MTQHDYLNELYIAYLNRAGESPKFSFWNWLDAIGAQPAMKEIKKILKEIDDYEI